MPSDTPPSEPPAQSGDGAVDDLPADGGAPTNRNRNLAIGAAIVVALVALVIAVAVIAGDDDDADDASGATGTTALDGGVGPGGTADPSGAAEGDDPEGSSDDPDATNGEGTEPGSSDQPGNTPGGNNNPGGNTPGETVPPEQLNEAYARGYTDVCNEVWSVSSSGLVYDPDEPGYGYPIEECTDYLDETLGEFEDTIEEAYEAGRAEAELIAESITFTGLLCDQSLERCWQVP